MRVSVSNDGTTIKGFCVYGDSPAERCVVIFSRNPSDSEWSVRYPVALPHRIKDAITVQQGISATFQKFYGLGHDVDDIYEELDDDLNSKLPLNVLVVVEAPSRSMLRYLESSVEARNYGFNPTLNLLGNGRVFIQFVGVPEEADSVAAKEFEHWLNTDAAYNKLYILTEVGDYWLTKLVAAYNPKYGEGKWRLVSDTPVFGAI